MDSRVIQSVATRLDLVLQVRNGRPEQRHGAGNVRGGHRCALDGQVVTVRAVPCGANVCARSSDIRLDPVAAVPGDGATAAKTGDGIGTVNQRSDCVGGLVERRWICHRGTRRAGVTRCYYHLDTSGFLSFNSILQFVADYTPFRDRATP